MQRRRVRRRVLEMVARTLLAGLATALLALVFSCSGSMQSSVLGPQSSDNTWGPSASTPGVAPECGGAPGLGTCPPWRSGSPPEATLDEALVELEALEPPPGVDESVFSQLKAALREALVHGVGARHAVPSPGAGTHPLTWIADSPRRASVSSATTGGTPVIQGKGGTVPRCDGDVQGGRRATGARPTESSPTTNKQHSPAVAGLTTMRGAESSPAGKTPPSKLASRPPRGPANRVSRRVQCPRKHFPLSSV